MEKTTRVKQKAEDSPNTHNIDEGEHGTVRTLNAKDSIELLIWP